MHRTWKVRKRLWSQVRSSVPPSPPPSAECEASPPLSCSLAGTRKTSNEDTASSVCSAPEATGSPLLDLQEYGPLEPALINTHGLWMCADFYLRLLHRMANRKALLGSSSPSTFPHRSGWSPSRLPAQGGGEATAAWRSRGNRPRSGPWAARPSPGPASSEPRAWTSAWAPEPERCWLSLFQCPPPAPASDPVGRRGDGMDNYCSNPSSVKQMVGLFFGSVEASPSKAKFHSTLLKDIFWIQTRCAKKTFKEQKLYCCVRKRCFRVQKLF